MSARQVALFVLFGLAEASVLAPVLIMLPTPLQALSEPAALGAAWLVLCAVGATGRAVSAARFGLSLIVQRVVMGVWLVALLLASVALVVAQQGVDAMDSFLWLVQLAGVLLIWWRALSLSGSDLEPLGAQQRLRNGLTLFALYAVVMLLNPAFNMLVFMLPFLAASLLGLPLSYLERVEQSDAGRHVPMTWPWWRAVLLSAGLSLLLCMAVLAVLTPDVLGQAISLVLGLITLPLLFLGGLIVQVLLDLVHRLLNQPQQPLEQPDALDDLSKRLQQQQAQTAPLVIDDRVLLTVVLIVVAVVLVAAVVTTVRVRRESARAHTRADEEQAQAAPGGTSEPGIGKTLRRTLDLRRWLAGVSVRRIYARMAHAAGKRGHARRPAQTPYDYLPELRHAFPGADDEVRLITEAYVATHYGEAPETGEELAAIRAAWERVRAR